jgi:hypothetical protein
MTKQFTAMMLSLSLALTAISTTPVRASEQDVFKALLGLGAVLAIGTVINKEKHRKKERRSHSNQRKHQPVTKNAPVGQWLKKEDFRNARKVAPNRCQREQWTHRGSRTVYGARCMQRHAKAQLPNRCLRRADTNNGPRQFYTVGCLRKNGWRT